MKEFSFRKIDAFTSGRSSGNGAAGIFLSGDEQITEQDMQRIAYELKGFVSEAVFLRPSENGEYDFELRYFSCEREVPFCGHGTIAVMYDYLKSRGVEKSGVMISTKKGILKVENRISSEDAVFITAPEPAFIDARISVPELADALSVDAGSIDDSIPVSIVNGGLNTLLVPLKTAESCISARPDYNRIRNCCLENNADIAVIYTGDVIFASNRFRSRVFAPTFGYLEDPATGSGSAALAYYLYSSGRWSGELFSIEQGPERDCPNLIKVFYDKEQGRVVFGGRADCRIAGRYFLTE